MSSTFVAPFTREEFEKAEIDKDVDTFEVEESIVKAFELDILEAKIVSTSDEDISVLEVKISDMLKKKPFDAKLTYHVEGKEYSVDFKEICYQMGAFYIYERMTDVLWSYEEKDVAQFKPE